MLEVPVESVHMMRMHSEHIAGGMAEMHGWRSEMEDSHVMVDCGDLGSLFSICDGHGGDACAKFVTKLLQKLANKLLTLVTMARDDDDSMKAILEDVFLEIDNAFHISVEYDEDQSGCTCILALILPTPEKKEFDIILAHVGDSRAALGSISQGYLVDSQGSHGPLTLDHSPERFDEADRIRKAGSFVQNVQGIYRVAGQLAVSRAFGDFQFKQSANKRLTPVIALPEISRIKWSSDDEFLVLFCDGITEGLLTNQRIVELAASEICASSDLASAARKVCRSSFAAGSMDNLTCMIISSIDHASPQLPKEEMEEGIFLAPRN